MNKEDLFWYNDHSVLFKQSRFLEFFPHKSLSNTRKLNATMRFGLYLSLVLSIYFNTPKFVLILIIVGCLTFLMFKQELSNKNIINTDKITIPREIPTEIPTEIPLELPLEISSKIPTEIPIALNDVSVESLENTCRSPTLDNPFMNKNLINSDDTLKNCNIENEDIAKEMKNYFNNNLFRNIDEIFDMNHSRRQFYTVPNNELINRQKDFAKWLYDTPLNCKTDTNYCLQREDVRNKRQVLQNSNENPDNTEARKK